MQKHLKTLLKRKQISLTSTRLFMLEVFLTTNEALDHTFFLNQPGHELERTTVFRTLNLFVKKKIIYPVPGTENARCYLLWRDRNGHSAASHSSFKCSNCGKVLPVNTVKLPTVRLPKGFKQGSVEIVVNGLCKSCDT